MYVDSDVMYGEGDVQRVSHFPRDFINNLFRVDKKRMGAGDLS